MASIYNIQTWESTSGPFKKNDVVKAGDWTYWDATKDHNSASAPDLQANEWGGNISITIGGSAQVKPYFFWVPTYDFSATHQPKVVELSFGDGYVQRLKDGINNDLLALQLTFSGRTEREVTAIAHFLKEKEGHKPFYLKAPAPYSLIKKFICNQWQTQMSYDDNYTIQGTFTEIS